MFRKISEIRIPSKLKVSNTLSLRQKIILNSSLGEILQTFIGTSRDPEGATQLRVCRVAKSTKISLLRPKTPNTS